MTQPQKKPAEVLANANPSAAEAFTALRKAVEAGPLDQQTVELIVIGSLAAVGQLGSLGVHVKRAVSLGVTQEQVNQAIVATLGASTLFNDVVAALRTAEAAVAG
ncbi:carboxymuconolactone decarboxylase family protein [Jatrophihabitans sp. DSM 45814]